MAFECGGRTGANRKLILHFHIFKNAGSSLDSMLASAFGPAWIPFEGDVPSHEPLRLDCVPQAIEGRAIEALSSHRLKPGTVKGLDVFPIVILRDPLDRAYSCFSYESRCPPNSESCEVARTTDFAGYVKWCLDHPQRGGMVIIDYQTIHLSAASLRGRIYDAVATPQDGEQAAQFLNALPLVGVVDRFDSFCVRLREALDAWVGRPLDLGEVRRVNISPERPRRPLAETKTHLRTLLGEQTAQRFERANQLDQGLYERASRLAAVQHREFLNIDPAYGFEAHRRMASAAG